MSHTPLHIYSHLIYLLCILLSLLLQLQLTPAELAERALWRHGVVLEEETFPLVVLTEKKEMKAASRYSSYMERFSGAFE